MELVGGRKLKIGTDVVHVINFFRIFFTNDIEIFRSGFFFRNRYGLGTGHKLLERGGRLVFDFAP